MPDQKSKPKQFLTEEARDGLWATFSKASEIIQGLPARAGETAKKVLSAGMAILTHADTPAVAAQVATLPRDPVVERMVWSNVAQGARTDLVGALVNQGWSAAVGLQWAIVSPVVPDASLIEALYGHVRHPDRMKLASLSFRSTPSTLLGLAADHIDATQDVALTALWDHPELHTPLAHQEVLDVLINRLHEGTHQAPSQGAPQAMAERWIQRLQEVGADMNAPSVLMEAKKTRVNHLAWVAPAQVPAHWADYQRGSNGVVIVEASDCAQSAQVRLADYAMDQILAGRPSALLPLLERMDWKDLSEPLLQTLWMNLLDSDAWMQASGHVSRPFTRTVPPDEGLRQAANLIETLVRGGLKAPLNPLWSPLALATSATFQMDTSRHQPGVTPLELLARIKVSHPIALPDVTVPQLQSFLAATISPDRFEHAPQTASGRTSNKLWAHWRSPSFKVWMPDSWWPVWTDTLKKVEQQVKGLSLTPPAGTPADTQARAKLQSIAREAHAMLSLAELKTDLAPKRPRMRA